MIKELIKLATHLDECGLSKEADYLDVVIRKMAGGKHIKCRWCEWETPMWTQRKKKKPEGPESAWGRLLGHVHDEHEKELQGVISDSGASGEGFGRFAPEFSAKERPVLKDRPDLFETMGFGRMAPGRDPEPE